MASIYYHMLRIRVPVQMHLLEYLFQFLYSLTLEKFTHRVYTEDSALTRYLAADKLLYVLGARIQGYEKGKHDEDIRQILPILLQMHLNFSLVDDLTLSISLFEASMSHCLLALQQYDMGLTEDMMNFFLKRWPRGCAKLATTFLSRMELLLEACPDAVYTTFDRVWIETLAGKNILGSLHHVIALKATFLLKKPFVVDKMKRLSHVDTVKLLVRPLLKWCVESFSLSAKNSAFEVLETFEEAFPTLIDAEQFAPIRTSFQAHREKERLDAEDCIRRKFLPVPDINPRKLVQVKVLGKGAYGEVREVKLIGSHPQQAYWTPFALKVMKKAVILDNHMEDQVALERTLLSSLSHPNVIRSVGEWEDASTIHILLEHCEKDVFHLLETYGSLPPLYTLWIMQQLCVALHYLHEHQVVHLDIKPENLLLCATDTQGGAGVKVCDFGSAWRMQDPLPSEIPGTLAFNAPECFLSPIQLSPSCDIFSAGVLWFQLLTGRTPFKGNDQNRCLDQAYLQVCEKKAIIPPEIGPVLHAMMSEDPTQRPSAKDMISLPLFEGLGGYGSKEPKLTHGKVKKVDIPLKFRQRRQSRMFTLQLCKGYSMDEGLFDPIPDF